MVKRICVALLLAVACAAQAAEVRGVNLPENTQVGASALVLNGAGLRTRLMFKIYVGALYLTEKKADAAGVLALKGSKRVALHMLRDLSAEQLSHALDEGLNANLTAAEQEKFRAEFEALHATMNAVGNAKEKSVITIDYVAEAGATRIAIDGAARGAPIPGEEFYRALLKIWLGDKPVDADLKAGLLGKG